MDKENEEVMQAFKLNAQIQMYKEYQSNQLDRSEISQESIQKQLRQVKNILKSLDDVKEEDDYVDALCEMEAAIGVAERHTRQLLFRIESIRHTANDELDRLDSKMSEK